MFIKAASSGINLCCKSDFSTFFYERQERVIKSLNPDVFRWQKVLYCHPFFSSMEEKKKQKHRQILWPGLFGGIHILSRAPCHLPLESLSTNQQCATEHHPKGCSLDLPLPQRQKKNPTQYGVCLQRKGKQEGGRRLNEQLSADSTRCRDTASPRDRGARGCTEDASAFDMCWFRSCTGMSQSHCNACWPLPAPLKCILMLMCF